MNKNYVKIILSLSVILLIIAISQLFFNNQVLSSGLKTTIDTLVFIYFIFIQLIIV